MNSRLPAPGNCRFEPRGGRRIFFWVGPRLYGGTNFSKGPRVGYPKTERNVTSVSHMPSEELQREPEFKPASARCHELTDDRLSSRQSVTVSLDEH